ncbi:MAG: hypothetical protein HY270_04105 [Deltaproteobacteria bacterium]|nr:hypothetical protein [Deltaproteobacteria bacterium]
MFRRSESRILVLVVFGALAAYDPYHVHDWVWRGVRDFTNGRVGWLFGWIAAATIAAECLGAWVPAWAPRVRRPLRWAVAIALLSVAVLYWWRVPQWMGDYHDIDRDLIPVVEIESAEPLGTILSTHVIRIGADIGILPSTAVAIESSLWGASAIAAIFLFARTISPEWPLRFAMLTLAPYVVLWCGYPEKGTPKSVALICWYVAVTTMLFRRETRTRFALSNIFLGLIGLMHGSGLCWLPAHLWYVWRGRPLRALAGVALFLLPGAVPLAYYLTGSARLIGGNWGNIAAPWQWIKKYCITNCGYDFISMPHLLDITDYLVMFVPLALLCLPETVANLKERRERWLALGALGWLFLSCAWFPVFGYIGDWDIFAGTPLVLSFLVVSVATRVMSASDFRRLALAWITICAIQTGLWWRFFYLPL